MDQQMITDWPGKSPCPGSDVEHPAAYHMLDAAAVAECLLAQSDLSPGLRDACTLLICLHDIGKMTPSFRDMLRLGKTQPYKHWELSEVLLEALDATLADILGATPHARAELVAAIAGHHGKPSRLTADDKQRAVLCCAPSLPVAEGFIRAAHALWPDASLEGVDLAAAKRLGWWLAGQTTAADWIGSNTDWFPPSAAGPDLADYMANARDIAPRAVATAGLIPGGVRTDALYDFAPRPMQAACAAAALPDGPTLAVIEDETGSGKTEAAMMLAQKMLDAGKGRGLFFALPTMATADAMFARAAETVGRLFDAPSLALAHGRAALSGPFRDIVGAEANGEDTVTCAPWLADGRRKALLAQVGVGTVDQALLAVLPTRFATLRLWGLASKILIVDEVHEMGDPYMSAELERLLTFHAAQGGSAILMTATLPAAQKSALIAAYARGRGAATAAATDDPAYPALTVLGDRHTVQRVPAKPPARGAVGIEHLPDADAGLAALVHASGQGAACVWVRNAVDDAIDAVDRLHAAGVKADLLHARFALSDRKTCEGDTIARFGRDGQGRAGRVLVATQVVESSLDLDFDVMVSDLAPMAALIQRAGRLWRHMDRRPAGARPVPAPVLQVVAPDPDAVPDALWLRRVLDRGAFVYPIADQWRSARVLFDAGQIGRPDTLRGLIEPVHGQDPIPVPDVLSDVELRDEGDRIAGRIRGRQNVVTLEDGYRAGGGGIDDTKYPTRLGVEQRVLVLARDDGAGRLRPWAGGDGAEAWMQSEVQAAAYRLDRLALPDQSAPAIRAVTGDWPQWKQAAAHVCPVAADGTICEGLRYDSKRGLLFTE